MRPPFNRGANRAKTGSSCPLVESESDLLYRQLYSLDSGHAISFPRSWSALNQNDATRERREAIRSREIGLNTCGLRVPHTAERSATPPSRVELAVRADLCRRRVAGGQRSRTCRFHRQPRMCCPNRRAERLHVRLRNHFERPRHLPTRRWWVRSGWIDLDGDGAAPRAGEEGRWAGRPCRCRLSSTGHGDERQQRERALPESDHIVAPFSFAHSGDHGSRTNRSCCAS